MATTNTANPWDVLIAGAGPVGLLLANLLGRQGVRVLLVDKRVTAPPWSMAIGITPPSLHILQQLGLDQKLVARGVRIRTAVVHGRTGELGRVSFDELPGEHPYILSAPQSETMRLLEEPLASYPSVQRRTGVEVIGAANRGPLVYVRLKVQDSGREYTVPAHFLAACDGHKSAVRKLAHQPAATKDYRRSFLMADFNDRSALGDEAHLFFGPRGSVESFPLPDQRRRWVVMTDRFMEKPAAEFLPRVVEERTGHRLALADLLGQSPFTARRLLAHRYFVGRMVFCGDAAHVMSPIGGQGMNTGFADAEFLADTLLALTRKASDPEPALARYEHFRRHAFRVASARAARGMWLGTLTGTIPSALRELVLRHVLLGSPLRQKLPSYFAMLTIPYRNLNQVPDPLRSLPT